MEELHLEKELSTIKKRATEILEHSHTMLSTSIEALFNADDKLADKVIHTFEKRMNELEVLLEERCIEAIALHQPKAKNLRYLIMLIKINNDLERMGDLALSIASYTLDFIDMKTNFDISFLRELANATLKLHSLMQEMLIHEDTDKAITVIKKDSTINALRDNAIKVASSKLSVQNNDFHLFYCIVRIIQRLERVGDLCKNIAEDTLYIADGSIYKH